MFHISTDSFQLMPYAFEIPLCHFQTTLARGMTLTSYDKLAWPTASSDKTFIAYNQNKAYKENVKLL